MSDMNLELIGDDELLAALREMDYKTQHKFLKRTLNKSADIYKNAVKRAIPKRTTKLQPSGVKWHPPGAGIKSVGKKMGKSKRVATVFVGPRTRTGDYATDGWYLKFWEYGTKYRPPEMKITAAYASRQQEVENSMMSSLRTIISRAWNKTKK